ncbi:hypothetical protein BGW38_010814 [Lunasporangiospora selenospora]|uniref:Uncharacterized protein n=1 Tax=Lunasporangiospora selenospora TaxID=979761 RepID=A0A9P6KI92_9FUNG|nr:hypothetical protein BGW38_010814 [Lunasporangiospora selenospora]
MVTLYNIETGLEVSSFRIMGGEDSMNTSGCRMNPGFTSNGSTLVIYAKDSIKTYKVATGDLLGTYALPSGWEVIFTTQFFKKDS